jgi:hypothetical protein
MLRLSQATNSLFSPAFIAMSMFTPPTFANIGGGNVDQFLLVTNGYLTGSAHTRFPAAPFRAQSTRRASGEAGAVGSAVIRTLRSLK